MSTTLVRSLLSASLRTGALTLGLLSGSFGLGGLGGCGAPEDQDGAAPPVATTAAATTTSATTEYAPYFYTWGFGSSDYRFRSLMELKSKSGLKAATLAFVVAGTDGGDPCRITNDGARNLIEGDMRADIAAFRAAGGKLKVSFGGATGLNLDSDSACGTADALFNVLDGFVGRTGLTDLDFDVEQDDVLNDAVNAKRAAALARLQAARPAVKVSFTLTGVPRDTHWDLLGGMWATGIDVVQSALDAGVRISHINLMTMDYGEYYSEGRTMGELAISTVSDAKVQLHGLFPALSDAKLWAMLGATPMIGQNDVPSEVFTVADARTLTTFAKSRGLGLVAFWAIQRDQVCPRAGSGLDLCSQVNRASFDFHNAFKSLQP